MKNQQYCVIDADGYYIDFVLVFIEIDADGTAHNNIQVYVLKPGERLLDALPPVYYTRAHWNGDTWEETATAEEIAAHKVAQDAMAAMST